MTPETGNAVASRYSGLAEESCCLSCGGAAGYAEPAAGEVCLDLGSGRGTDAIRLSQKVGPEGFVYGIDISEGMLEKAKKTAEKLGVTNVSFLQSGLESLPLKTESVDLVISNCVLNHAENKDAVWREIYRVLKNGGRFVVSDIYSSADVPEHFANDPEAVAECWGGAVTRDAYIDTVEKAGFGEPVVLEESRPYPKGEITVSSFTITAVKQACCCRQG